MTLTTCELILFLVKIYERAKVNRALMVLSFKGIRETNPTTINVKVFLEAENALIISHKVTRSTTCMIPFIHVNHMKSEPDWIKMH